MNKTLGTGSIDRSARVHRIKRVIIGLVILAIILPSILCVILFAKLNKLERQVIELSYEREKVNVITESTLMTIPNKAEPVSGENTVEVINIEENEIEDFSNQNTAADENVSTIESNENEDSVIEEDIESDEDDTEKVLKKVYLTFDDGPSSNTAKILDILDEHGVKGTFFVVGRLSDTTTPMYKRIVNEGHAIGMHSYTHKYNEIYADKDSFVYDVEKIQSLIYEQTGVMSKLYRFPGGSSNRVSRTDMSELVKELEKRDIKYFDWNVVSGDASSTYGLSKEEIVRRCTQGALLEEEAVILMHDLPEKATTVAALPEIIEYFQSIGVEILPLSEDAIEVHHEIEMTE
ncbi:MAG: polysaccharide deacetylase family protein [Lachnospiraceae bacterium]|nr:polysaccharide deacetylase family protein [Lachnospiraceae bacterium]